jgi:SNF2 family DNA or RNA helicase
VGYEINIDESFADEDLPVIGNFKSNKFISKEIRDLKIDVGEISRETEITDLISYDMIKKNLEFHFHYQKEGALELLRDFNGSGLLADEVGLGKTVTTGIALKECIVRGFVKKVLILTPPSLVDQWVQELKDKFELDFKIIENENDWGDTDFAIASIDRVKIFDKNKGDYKHSLAHQIQWDMLIVDEAHKLKQRNTVRWRFVDKIQKKRFLALTATPFQNDLLELYNLLHLLKRGHLGTVKEFQKRFINGKNKRYPLNPRELKGKLDEVMIRRQRSETGIIYKQRIPKIISVEQTPEEKEVYQDICELLKKQYFAANGEELSGLLIIYALLPKITSSSKSAIESLEKIATNERYHPSTRGIAFNILEKYKKIKTDSKIKKLIEVIEIILKKDPNDKILIYTKHPTTLRYIVEMLKPYNLKILPFTGAQNREEKTEIIKEFRDNANVLISTETGSEGLNFQFCANLINYDLPWNPMAVEQRIGRLDRIGQERDMHIYSLATSGTMEEHIVDLIINKMCCVGLVIGELPIILFNLGLDGEGKHSKNKIEERLMNLFLESKNNLRIFSKGVEEISKTIEEGIKSYDEDKKNSHEVLDNA